MEAIAVTETAQELYELMSNISEEGWSAGWMRGTEKALWEVRQGRADCWGMTEVLPNEVELLKRLSEEADCWWIFDDGIDDFKQINLAEAEALFEIDRA